MDESLAERLSRYFDKAGLKFSSVKVLEESGRDVWDAARNYFNDAAHFREDGDLVSALAALEYAEGLVDAGRMLGLISAEHTGELE